MISKADLKKFITIVDMSGKGTVEGDAMEVDA